jgi:cytidine deaminase
MTNRELINKAISVIDTKKIGEYTVGNVGAALITDKGNVYCGVCIDVGSGMGFCAEHNAIGTMVTAGEYRISRIVAVWKDDNKNNYILSPCGRCREFMHQINKQNLEAEIILEENRVVMLRDLLPDYDWCYKI